MPYRDLQHFIEVLEQRGRLKRIRTEVSQDLEIAEITDRATKAGGPALLFENVKGHAMPVAINLFGSKDRMALGLEVDSLEKLPERLGSILALALNPPTGGFLEKIKTLPKLMEMASFMPKSVDGGLCKDVVLKGDQVDLEKLPVLKCWPEDGGRFITFPLVFTYDPETGKRNVGTYRMQVYDKKTTGMHFHWHKDGARHLRKSKAPLQVAVAIGCDPAMCFAATLPLPPDVDECLFAGLVRQEGTRLTKCETLDIEVPANAEIILEGTVDPAERRREGPFGDHTGYYSLEDDFPVFRVNAVTHRAKPVYHTTIVGPPPQEDGYIGYAIERLMHPLMKLQIPEMVDYHMPMEGVFHNLMIVSIQKRYPGHARKVMHTIWGLGQAMFTKTIVVVDEEVNVHDYREVAWKALNHIDPERDIEFVMGPIDILDHSSRLAGYGSHMGIDATTKTAGEGFQRRWPGELKMSPEIRAIVDKKWKDLGL
ncbi:MAG TPA: menaquinone biosynthesis decarboxylase [Planctomycetota bacterium]|nr:menaquinone biosynthesis decarboxylase [Planctomycetota bacterium]